MSWKHLGARGGCYYAEYAQEDAEMEWGHGYVQFAIKRSTLWLTVADFSDLMDQDRRDVQDLIDQQYGGDDEMYIGAKKGEDRRIEDLIQRCEREHPILKKLGNPPECSLHRRCGMFMWLILTDDEHEREALYQQLRNEAWAIWKNIPNFAKELGVEIYRLEVRPLPGPWRWKFL